jgi:acetylornithine/succinyldiaminopimelate/putrescine aminotransferase
MQDTHLIGVYRRHPVTLARGEGARVWDAQGKPYWDFLAGIGVNSLGYHHPDVDRVLRDASQLMHTSNLFWHQPGIDLSQRIADITDGMWSLWVNSGTEANEAGIKMMRRIGHDQGRYHIIAMTGAFHGRTLGSLSATPHQSYQEPFQPLVPGFVTVPYGDLDALAQALAKWNPCGVMMEPIQGEGGVVVPPPGYLTEAVRMIHQADSLILFDEVQTGAGRTGNWFGYQHEGELSPDLITVAKGIGAGMPIGGLLVAPKWAQAFHPGDHGTTFGGNPLASRMALTVIEWLDQGGLNHVREMSSKLEQGLGQLQQSYPQLIQAVRGRGLMWGLKTSVPAGPLVQQALAEGLIVNAAQPDIIRLLPPYVIDETAIAACCTILGKVLDQASRH